MRKCLRTKGRRIIEAHAARITSRFRGTLLLSKTLLEND